jgi:hypothetical protein
MGELGTVDDDDAIRLEGERRADRLIDAADNPRQGRQDVPTPAKTTVSPCSRFSAAISLAPSASPECSPATRKILAGARRATARIVPGSFTSRSLAYRMPAPAMNNPS